PGCSARLRSRWCSASAGPSARTMPGNALHGSIRFPGSSWWSPYRSRWGSSASTRHCCASGRRRECPERGVMPVKRNVLRVADRGWGTYRTVTAALRAAGRGAVIHVQPGVYRESLVLDSEVTVLAEKGPGTVRLVGSNSPAVSGGRADVIGDATAELRSCTVEDSRDTGVYVTGTAHVLLHDCVIRSIAGHGLTFNDAARADVQRTTVERVVGCGIAMTGQSQ